MKTKKLNTKVRKPPFTYPVQDECFLIGSAPVTIWYGGKKRIIPGVPKKIPKGVPYVT